MTAPYFYPIASTRQHIREMYVHHINNNQDGMTIEQIKENTIKEQERREREGETDQDAYLQSNIILLNIASVTMKKTGLLIFHGVMERLFLL
jgi:hypothetical protein